MVIASEYVHKQNDTQKNAIQGGQKTGPYVKVCNPYYDDVGRRSVYQNVQLFIRSKTAWYFKCYQIKTLFA